MKKICVAGSLILLVCCISASAALSGGNGGEWRYGREILIKEQTGTLLDFYTLPVSLDSAMFDFSKARPDGSDIRVTDDEGYERAFWIEEWNATAQHARIWISVPRIPAHGETVMRLYYGNPKATGTGSGGATFLFFDDFSSPSMNLENWITSGNEIRQENGGLRITSGRGYASSMIGFTRPVDVRFRYRTTGDPGETPGVVSVLCESDCANGSKDAAYRIKILGNGRSSRSGGLSLGDDLQSLGGAVPASFDASQWNVYELTVSNTSLQGIWGGISGSPVKETSLSKGKIALSAPCNSGCSGSSEWDWIAVRKYAGEDPSVTLSAESSAADLMQKAGQAKTPSATPPPTKTPGFAVIPACLVLMLILGLSMRSSR